MLHIPEDNILDEQKLEKWVEVWLKQTRAINVKMVSEGNRRVDSPTAGG
jgi:hypothetical protein